MFFFMVSLKLFSGHFFRLFGLILRLLISKKLCTCGCNEGDGTITNCYQLFSLFFVLNFIFLFFLFNLGLIRFQSILYRLIGPIICRLMGKKIVCVCVLKGMGFNNFFFSFQVFLIFILLFDFFFFLGLISLGLFHFGFLVSYFVVR